MKLTYLYSIDKYIGKYYSFTPEELSMCDDLEKQWLASQPNYTLHQLLEIFPQAKPTVKSNLLAEIKQLKQDLIRAEEVRINYNNRFISKADPQDKWLYTLLRDTFFIEPLTEGREAKIKKNYFLLSSLKPQTAGEVAGKITEADIVRAKEFPIENLYAGQLRLQGQTLAGKCNFHTEKTASFVIYKSNRWYCFGGCGGGDVLDFCMRQRNCTFIEAIKIILNK